VEPSVPFEIHRSEFVEGDRKAGTLHDDPESNQYVVDVVERVFE
jgi:hypothetical protein